MRFLAKDIALLHELFVNGRYSYSRIGKKIKVPKENVAYRLKNLKDNGIIEKIIPLVDYSKLGYRTYRIFLQANYTKEGYQKLVDSTELNWFANLSGGSWNVVAIFLFRNEQDFYSKIPGILGCFSHIQKYTISEVISINHFSPAFFTKKEKISYTTGNSSLVGISPIEEKILAQLFIDGRIPVLEIASRLKLSATAVTYHIKRMVHEKIIMSFIPVLSPINFGYDQYRIFFKLEKPQERDILNERLKLHPNVIYITNSLGSYDLECEVLFEHIHEVTNFCSELSRFCLLSSYEIVITEKVLVHNDMI